MKQLRQEAGLQQADAAARFGLESSYYAKIERGEQNSTIDTYEKIAQGYGLTLGEFFKGV